MKGGGEMSKSKVVLVFGARPQFIKSATVIREMIRYRINLTIVHSGQHYDSEMSDAFFSELKIPRPTVNLQVGSGSHAIQTAAIMKRFEAVLVKAKPAVVIVPGHTNTTLAAALCAAKLAIPVAHIEAGLRSGDMTMPEEINRILTDHCSSLLFAPTQTAASNLEKEGLRKLTHLTGDTMVDVLESAFPLAERRQTSILDRFKLKTRAYVLVTLHRPSNVDDPIRLGQILLGLRRVADKLPVLFPVHPRTRAKFASLGVLTKSKHTNIAMVPPQGYVETLALLKNASCILTDSGGLQKESFLLHVPCLTLRSSTEWPETLVSRSNRLVSNPKDLPREILSVALNEDLRRCLHHLKNPFGDGHASRRIAGIVERTVNHR